MMWLVTKNMLTKQSIKRMVWLVTIEILTKQSIYKQWCDMLLWTRLRNRVYKYSNVTGYYWNAYQTEYISNDVIGYFKNTYQTQYTNSDVIGYLLLVGPEVWGPLCGTFWGLAVIPGIWGIMPIWQFSAKTNKTQYTCKFYTCITHLYATLGCTKTFM